MKYLSWIITLPITVIVVIFAISNLHEVAFGFWPLEGTFSLELYIAILLTFVVGFVCGGVVLWFSAGKVRRRARKAEFEAVGLKRENASLKQQASREAATQAHKSAAAASGGTAPLQIGASPSQTQAASASSDTAAARLTGT
ncbi:lipopolysaccharide assembly protein LapA domain-containing protein [Pelagibius sp. Alg239-R121]|uniref:lipopolysaccharide assembly protein LapA domain-containing protein n=1 Tax=Pelagibius sp. Alg239-R121 TaxID=2993448 RepID=UPI0024A6D279|nr:lipopolysaccharide assembly protein LapA domain-containing protein [Pelagibius sp. Alg239-R121]